MKPSRTERIGILGGTFDPIHIGHLLLSEFIKDELELDYVLFLPARIHPLKENAGITAAHHRLEMVRLAIEDNTSFMVSDIELRRETVSYTIDTLISL
ncbi:MAG: nicotinate-nucleotide adenylyltransferase, partial [Calditrichaeota bacterium]